MKFLFVPFENKDAPLFYSFYSYNIYKYTTFYFPKSKAGEKSKFVGVFLIKDKNFKNAKQDLNLGKEDYKNIDKGYAYICLSEDVANDYINFLNKVEEKHFPQSKYILRKLLDYYIIVKSDIDDIVYF